jgi:hypothetical protein
MLGSPGTGKSMLARRLATMLPDMTLAEAWTPGQRDRLRTFIQTSTSHLRPAGHDQVWLEEITQHLSETWFAWMGSVGDNDVFMRRCTVRCCVLSVTWRALWALLHTFGASVVTPSVVGSRGTC